MTNTTAVSNFQIQFSGITLEGIYGGSAELANYQLSVGVDNVLGVPTGTAIPEGEGVLATISFSSAEENFCFTEGVSTYVLDAVGNLIDISLDICFQYQVDCNGVLYGTAIEVNVSSELYA